MWRSTIPVPSTTTRRRSPSTVQTNPDRGRPQISPHRDDPRWVTRARVATRAATDDREQWLARCTSDVAG